MQTERRVAARSLNLHDLIGLRFRETSDHPSLAVRGDSALRKKVGLIISTKSNLAVCVSPSLRLRLFLINFPNT